MPFNVEKFKELMQGRSQVDVARAAGITQPQLSRFITGKRSPRLDVLDRLAKALGCSAKDLIV